MAQKHTQDEDALIFQASDEVQCLDSGKSKRHTV